MVKQGDDVAVDYDDDDENRCITKPVIATLCTEELFLRTGYI
jgi:hypothetical protein